ncbi:MAG: serine protease [Desulfovibrio sp.]|jgi:S1-C subfamily serine protease|nr:serine protease [Desulfovibrio sp.]
MFRIRLFCRVIAPLFLVLAMAACSAHYSGGGGGGGGGGGTGKVTATGFYVTDNGVLVTCGHVLRSQKMRVETSQGSIPATILHHDRTMDIAILQVAARTVPVSLEDGFMAQRGDEVTLLGYPLPSLQGPEMKATFGRVNSLSGVRGDRKFFQLDAAVQPGNSGGPVFDAQGRVMGVLLRSLDEEMVRGQFRSTPQNVNYALKVDLVRKVLYAAGITPRENAAPMGGLTQRITKLEPSVVMVSAN